MEDKGLLKTLKEYWFIILFIVQFVYMTAFNQSDHALFAKEITDLQNKTSITETTLADIRSRLASIDTNLEYLKKNNK